ncbi:uncharacterized protein CELE_M04C7.3 [Caenorhabditis elegans]|uniref:Uncharacterized protein n=1 Tax=Caenorhabditis elegans TaxID=6239 RepID=P91906_CAEEL|nr:Uncharacterized protein CELE_M04C7.3 [Caenorhabditis elegans]CAB05569.1 Uncharacterized protein CELE_M04C7.3 [Caenorhabditis elegans]|eukprot:NP_492314.1 Uncharacterized protein CELE_M04C7.3 [Caenorhabditis elegans]
MNQLRHVLRHSWGSVYDKTWKSSRTTRPNSGSGRGIHGEGRGTNAFDVSVSSSSVTRVPGCAVKSVFCDYGIVGSRSSREVGSSVAGNARRIEACAKRTENRSDRRTNRGQQGGRNKSRFPMTTGKPAAGKEAHLDDPSKGKIAVNGDRFRHGTLLSQSLRQNQSRQVVRGSAPITDHAATRNRGRYTASGRRRTAPSPGSFGGFCRTRGEVLDRNVNLY